jgi:hypothetical protein
VDERLLMWSSLLTGLIAVAFTISSLCDPAYYDPQTAADYVASALGEFLLVAMAFTLVVWWRVTPVRRGAWFLLVAAGGFMLWSIGNFLEEILRVEFGVYLFFVGSPTGYVSTGIAGFAALTSPSRWRWSGLVLLGVVLSLSNQDFMITPIPWLAFAFVLWHRLLDEPPAVISDTTELSGG